MYSRLHACVQLFQFGLFRVTAELKKYELVLKELMTTLLRCLAARDNHHVQGVLNYAVTVLSFAYKFHDKQKYSRAVQNFFHNWLVKNSVVGGSMFGFGYSTRSKKLSKRDTEVKVISFRYHSVNPSIFLCCLGLGLAFSLLFFHR